MALSCVYLQAAMKALLQVLWRARFMAALPLRASAGGSAKTARPCCVWLWPWQPLCVARSPGQADTCAVALRTGHGWLQGTGMAIVFPMLRARFEDAYLSYAASELVAATLSPWTEFLAKLFDVSDTLGRCTRSWGVRRVHTSMCPCMIFMCTRQAAPAKPCVMWCCVLGVPVCVHVCALATRAVTCVLTCRPSSTLLPAGSGPFNFILASEVPYLDVAQGAYVLSGSLNSPFALNADVSGAQEGWDHTGACGQVTLTCPRG